MTLSISDTQIKKEWVIRTILIYLGITLFCAFFSWVYEQHSHGVYSNYMIYVFLFPLVGGVLLFSVLGVSKRLPKPSRFSLNAHHAGIATLALGSALQGALEIYGTTSGYITGYWMVGSLLLLVAASNYGNMVMRDYRQTAIIKRSA